MNQILLQANNISLSFVSFKDSFSDEHCKLA